MENKPAYHVSASERDGILEIVLTGQVERDSVKHLTDEVQYIVKSRNAQMMLADMRGLKSPKIHADVYTRMKNYPPFFLIKTAVVGSPEDEDFHMFQEASATIFGMELKWHTTTEAARAWLKNTNS